MPLATIVDSPLSEQPAEYEFHFSVDLAKLLPSVGQVVDSVNDAMNSFGFSEKLVVRSKAIACRLSGVRELTAAEQEKAAHIILAGIREKLPQYDVSYEGCNLVKP